MNYEDSIKLPGGVTRRGFIRLSTLAGTALLLEACGGSSAPASSAPSSAAASSAAAKPSVSVAASAASSAPAAAKPSAPAAGGSALPSVRSKQQALLPTYTPLQGGPKPDYHSSDPRITDGFENYPKNPVQFMKTAPGKGGQMTPLLSLLFPPPTPYDQNPTWKEVNKQLNENVQFNLVSGADYPTRLATTLASNDLPDTLWNVGGLGAGSFGGGFPPEFLKAKAQDLTPYLSGDNSKNFPNLANIPSYSWRTSVAAGSLWAVPIHRYLPTFWLFKNTDMWDKEVGANVVPKDKDDFKKILQQLNNPKGNRWAIGNYVGPQNMGLVGYAEMFGAPNNWRLDASGKLTKDYETEEYKAAVGYLRDLVASNLFPPDASQTGKNSRDDFVAGKFVTSVEAFGQGYSDFWRRGLAANPPNHFSLLTPFSATAGQKPVHYFSGGLIGVNILKKASDDRVKEVLGILNWLSSPFGTAEDLLLSYGLKDSDYTLDENGNPKPTKDGTQRAAYVPWQYLGHRPFVWFDSGLPGYAKAAFEAEQQLVAVGIDDPTIGYLSATATGKGIVASNNFRDGINDILLGRRPLTDYDSLVKDWLNAAGEQIRKELQDAIAAEK
jgi:putative aldouronate transport system substrate-binding protein